MTDTRVVRAFFGATSLIVTFALVLPLFLSVTRGSDEGSFTATPDRITLVRGAFVLDRLGNYPYPFMNVGVHGYPLVLLNVLLVAVLFLAISFGALALDRRLPGVRVG